MSLAALKRWSSTSAWALIDQITFAAANFLINILLAGWVSPPQYGTYTIAFSIFLLAGAIHSGLFSNPMMVLSSGKYKDCMPEYLGGLLYCHAIFSAVAIACTSLAALVSWLIGHTGFASAFLFMGLAIPFVYFQWLMRHAAYAVLRPQLAAAAGTFHCVAVIGVVSVCASLGLLTKESKHTSAIAFTVIGAVSLCSAYWLSIKLKVERDHATCVRLMRDLAAEHKNLGSWGSGVVILHWVSGECVLLISPFMGGLEFTAIVKALMNLITPVNRIFTAFGTLAVVVLGRARAAGKFRQAMSAGFMAGGLIGVAYWLTLGVFHDEITTLLYREEEIYRQNGSLIWIIGLMAIVGGAKAVLEPALWAMKNPKALFVSYVISTLFILTVGIALMAFFEIKGIAFALVSGGIVSAMAMSAFVIKGRSADS